MVVLNKEKVLIFHLSPSFLQKQESIKIITDSVPNTEC
jgi:hypothetical protein